MGVPGDDDVVQIQEGRNPGEPCVITVNCPDKTGLGCDICRIILEFGLYITKGDVSTDGIWCYIVLWVVPRSALLCMRWSNLKDRLQAICPPCLASFYFNQQPTRSFPVYLLKFCCLDRKGLLHDVTQVFCELELTLQKVKVTTTPDGRVLDLFFITDNMELMHTKNRQDETCKRLQAVLQDSCISCELQLAGPEYECNQALSSDMRKLRKTNVTLDNSISPAHTLLQIRCADHKGLLYDTMRALKDMNMKILYGRFSPRITGYCDLDLFIQQKDGKKIVDPEKQSALCSRLKLEMLHPLRVIIANRGPDTELVVANPVELSGKGRPRVFYDVTFVLKALGICIFSAEIGRRSASEREWEVYRFLLDENCEFQLTSIIARNQIVDKVRRTLMGW
ncbi:ACT domain-containing protein ACR9 isoform X2 [Neltuma alba]|uniref:ACT domain-containing protein ACR9 isoform X2 n=1 Tax=Neltuma alba TaxID=207710 RepID=UPI0010A46A9D|nr:ACT domain-containing protein ACR9 isoform X2 [Prosopis alba]